MTEELEQLLKNLKLRRMLQVYDEQLHAAEKADVSYSEFVAGLLRAQWHDRQESALEWRIGRANLPCHMSTICSDPPIRISSNPPRNLHFAARDAGTVPPRRLRSPNPNQIP